MFIPITGGVGFVPVGKGNVTMALTDPTGSVVVEQYDGVSDWFPVVYNGTSVTLNSDNTMVSIYSPTKVRVTATGTGVYLKG